MNEKSEIAILVAVSIVSSLLLYLPFALNVHAILGVQLPATGITVIERYTTARSTPWFQKRSTPRTPISTVRLACRPRICGALARLPVRNMALFARNCSARRDGGGEPCDLRRGSGHFLRVHDTIQTGARSIFLLPVVPFLPTALVLVPERRRIRTALHARKLTDALRFEKRCAGQGDALRRRGFADTDMGRAQFLCW